MNTVANALPYQQSFEFSHQFNVKNMTKPFQYLMTEKTR